MFKDYGSPRDVFFFVNEVPSLVVLKIKWWVLLCNSATSRVCGINKSKNNGVQGKGED